MAPSRESPRSTGSAPGSSLVLSAMAGAVLGAAGLAWWLLSEADQRRRRRGPLIPVRPPARPPLGAGAEGPPATDTALHERVQQLNLAIDEVRRQLEELQTQP